MSEDGVLLAQAAGKGAVEFGAQSELAHAVGLFGRDDIALLLEALVLETVQTGVPGLDVGRTGVNGGGGRRGDGGSEGGRVGVGRQARRVAVLAVAGLLWHGGRVSWSCGRGGWRE